jgi:hypothetical protein
MRMRRNLNFNSNSIFSAALISIFYNVFRRIYITRFTFWILSQCQTLNPVGVAMNPPCSDAGILATSALMNSCHLSLMGNPVGYPRVGATSEVFTTIAAYRSRVPYLISRRICRKRRRQVVLTESNDTVISCHYKEPIQI